MHHNVIEFVKAAIRNPKEVCTVFPTSKFLAAKLLNEVEIKPDSYVVEVGAGTGAITEPLLERLSNPRQQYLGIEIVEPMVQFLKKSFPRLNFAQGSVQGMEKLLNDRRADAVVSSLPWTIFDLEQQKQGVESIYRSLKKGGTFVTYMCLNSAWYPQAKSFQEMLAKNFSHVEKTAVEWRNMPPAFVLKAIK